MSPFRVGNQLCTKLSFLSQPSLKKAEARTPIKKKCACHYTERCLCRLGTMSKSMSLVSSIGRRSAMTGHRDEPDVLQQAVLQDEDALCRATASALALEENGINLGPGCLPIAQAVKDELVGAVALEVLTSWIKIYDCLAKLAPAALAGFADGLHTEAAKQLAVSVEQRPSVLATAECRDGVLRGTIIPTLAAVLDYVSRMYAVLSPKFYLGVATEFDRQKLEHMASLALHSASSTQHKVLMLVERARAVDTSNSSASALLSCLRDEARIAALLKPEIRFVVMEGDGSGQTTLRGSDGFGYPPLPHSPECHGRFAATVNTRAPTALRQPRLREGGLLDVMSCGRRVMVVRLANQVHRVRDGGSTCGYVPCLAAVEHPISKSKARVKEIQWQATRAALGEEPLDWNVIQQAWRVVRPYESPLKEKYLASTASSGAAHMAVTQVEQPSGPDNEAAVITSTQTKLPAVAARVDVEQQSGDLDKPQGRTYDQAQTSFVVRKGPTEKAAPEPKGGALVPTSSNFAEIQRLKSWEKDYERNQSLLEEYIGEQYMDPTLDDEEMHLNVADALLATNLAADAGVPVPTDNEVVHAKNADVGIMTKDLYENAVYPSGPVGTFQGVLHLPVSPPEREVCVPRIIRTDGGSEQRNCISLVFSGETLYRHRRDLIASIKAVKDLASALRLYNLENGDLDLHYVIRRQDGSTYVEDRCADTRCSPIENGKYKVDYRPSQVPGPTPGRSQDRISPLVQYYVPKLLLHLIEHTRGSVDRGALDAARWIRAHASTNRRAGTENAPGDIILVGAEHAFTQEGQEALSALTRFVQSGPCACGTAEKGGTGCVLKCNKIEQVDETFHVVSGGRGIVTVDGEVRPYDVDSLRVPSHWTTNTLQRVGPGAAVLIPRSLVQVALVVGSRDVGRALASLAAMSDTGDSAVISVMQGAHAKWDEHARHPTPRTQVRQGETAVESQAAASGFDGFETETSDDDSDFGTDI